MKHIYFATGNDSKFIEARDEMRTLAPDIELEHLDVDIPEIQSGDPREILLKKIEHVRSLTTKPFMVDDATFDTDKYPGFPGPYTKFVNSTLGRAGLEALYENGDKIQAIARIALNFLDDTYFFEGRLNGSFGFDGATGDGQLMNDLMLVDGVRLGDALKDPDFSNHRAIALGQLAEWLNGVNTGESTQKQVIGERWSERSAGWSNIIEDTESYVNFEDNYARVNSMIRKFAPLISGNALEIGCGSGEAGRILKQSNPNLVLLSTDIADGMLAEATRQTHDAGLDIEYRKVDITKDSIGSDRFSFVISRGVVISHLPKGDIWDYLEAVTRSTKSDAHFLFDFIQSVNIGDVDKPVDTKNEFTLESMDEIMSELGWVRVDESGSDTTRVRVVCYKKESEGK